MEMKENYSTGELAKLCHVSIRTVQFYDMQGIIKPSAISEGGRRVYTDKELQMLRSVCLYKALGLTLNEIKEGMKSGSNRISYEKC
jgi:DNA-binding transcriptional MerR regulator